MNQILVFSIILVTKFTSGYEATFPVDEDSNYDTICANSSVIINFSGLKLNNIKKNFISSPVVHCLDLSDNHIESVDDGAFGALPNLKLLNISNNKLDINNVLDSVNSNLETLILDNNRYNCEGVQNVQVNANHRKLKRLFIRRNCGSLNFNPSFKLAFPSLTHLYFRETHLTAGGLSYQWLPNNLEYLELSGHNLREVTLRYLDYLRYLVISDPREKRLTTLNLQGLTNLKYLSAVSNGDPLNFVEFPIVPSLEFLDLSDNNLEFLQGAPLYHMTNLRFFNLSRNHIRDMEGGAFDRLANLEVLVLEGNQITAIPALTNVRLKVLFLNCNSLAGVAAGAFKNLVRLEGLYLNDNEISHIDQEAFSGLRNLKTLALSNNLLKSLPQNWMLPLVPNIVDLDLRGNRLTDFADLALSEWSPLKQLRLSVPFYLDSQDVIPENVTVEIDSSVTISVNFNESLVEICTKSDKAYC